MSESESIGWIVWVVSMFMAMFLGKRKYPREFGLIEYVLCVIWAPFMLLFYIFKDSPFDTPNYIYKPTKYHSNYDAQLEKYNRYWEEQPWYASKPVMIIFKIIGMISLFVILPILLIMQ